MCQTGGNTLTLAEPIPTIEKKNVPEFNERWKKFKLSVAQKELYKEAEELYKENPS